nr:putative Ig domain-containing protein [Microbacterium endophyticum]
MWALTGSQTVQASGTVIPTVTSSAPTKATVGAEYSYTLTASGTAPVSWTISNGSLPDGLSLDSHGGISGTPTSEGTSTFSARASNFAGWEDVELSITVGAPPVITSGSPQSATVGEAYSFGFTATGVAPMSWAVTSGTLPPGLEFSAAGALTGTPAEVGSTTFAVTVTDDNGTAAQDVTLVVTPAPLPPVITSGEPDVATVGDSYSFTFTATGTAPVTWAMTVGTLPQGLSLSNSGVLSGTPTVAGTYTFTLAASDENGRTTKDITLSVTAANTVPPVITSSATIVDVVEGKPFNFQFTATGTGPFTWLVAAGAGALSLDGPRSMGMSVGAALPTPGLPPGLTVSASGLLSGVPTAEGTYGFTIRATGPGGTQTQSVEVTVIPVSADGDLATTGSSNDMLAIATLIALLALALGIVLAMRRGRA